MNNKLETKDLINVGIFTAMYFVCFFLVGMIGLIPIMLITIPFFVPLVGGIPFMLYMTKIHKFGMITITGIICGLLMMLTGHPWPVLVFTVAFALIGDLILKAGNYKSSKHVIISYAVFSEWMIGGMLPLFFMRNSYIEMLESGYGAEYAEIVKNITPPWLFYVMIVMAFVGGLLGALLGKKILKKHFKKAGIV